ncbi:hypothetical protein L204_106277 [Cryptococcus depauperatus]|nr:hypothetical protein L204_05841 [Cryptococcus depauperatus CBS 7855]
MSFESSLSASPNPVSEATLYYLLSLPPLLQPLSPPHAALHLARLRLLLSIPTDKPIIPSDIALPIESTGTVVGRNILGSWCHRCGGLRRGTGGAERNRHSTFLPQEISKEKEKEVKTRAIREKARKRVVANAGLPEKEREDKRMARKLEIGSAIEQQKKRRLPAECTTCGAAYTRPKPNRATSVQFQPARRTRRQAQEIKEKEIANGAQDSTRQDCAPPSTPLLSHHPYLHISSSPPDLPTHPPPPRTLVASGIQATSSSDGSKKKRKVKKSGLSKLLAENKERAEASKSGRMWGF